MKTRTALPFLLLLATAAASAAEVADLWRRGDADGALALVREQLAADPDDPEARRWLHRLTPDPAELGDAASPAEAAGLALVRGDQRTLDALIPADAATPPAAAVLLAGGLAARRRGDADAARDRLAAVRPEDPEYAWARYHLAQIALAEGDAALARRYLDTADAAPRPVAAAAVLAARWELVRAADPEAGQRLERELAHRFPASNELARVRELQRRDRELAASAEPAEIGAAPEPPARGSGRFALQLAAFGDRGRAMTFRDAWIDHVPDLVIAGEAGPNGVPVYRLRSGRFATRDQAAAAAEQLRRRHDLEALVVELPASP